MLYTAAVTSSIPEADTGVELKATIILVNYNGRAYVEDSLQAVCGALDSDTEVIVFDNASQDGSPEIIAQQFPQVRLIQSTQNLGFGGGNNLAAAYAQGEYLLFLNMDTMVTPGWAEALIAPLVETPQVGLTTPKILLWRDQKKINTCGNDMHLSGLTMCRGLGKSSRAFNEPALVTAVSGAAFAIRKALFEELGGFDEQFFMYVEDTDLSWRARLAGYHCLYIPEAIVYHDYALTFGPQKTLYQERNRYFMLVKQLHWLTLLLLGPVLLLAEIVTWGFVLLRDRARWQNKLHAYGALWRAWPDLMVQRRHTQSLRQISDRALLANHSYRLSFEQTGATIATKIAHWLFDPLFFLWQKVMRVLLWW